MVQSLNFFRNPLKGLPNSGPPRKFSRAPGITVLLRLIDLGLRRVAHVNIGIFRCLVVFQPPPPFLGNYLGKLKIIQTTENHSGKLGIYQANWELFRKTGKHSEKLGIIRANWELFR
jgi:hypothetical protein